MHSASNRSKRSITHWTRYMDQNVTQQKYLLTYYQSSGLESARLPAPRQISGNYFFLSLNPACTFLQKVSPNQNSYWHNLQAEAYSYWNSIHPLSCYTCTVIDLICSKVKFTTTASAASDRLEMSRSTVHPITRFPWKPSETEWHNMFACLFQEETRRTQTAGLGNLQACGHICPVP